MRMGGNGNSKDNNILPRNGGCAALSQELGQVDSAGEPFIQRRSSPLEQVLSKTASTDESIYQLYAGWKDRLFRGKINMFDIRKNAFVPSPNSEGSL